MISAKDFNDNTTDKSATPKKVEKPALNYKPTKRDIAIIESKIDKSIKKTQRQLKKDESYTSKTITVKFGSITLNRIRISNHIKNSQLKEMTKILLRTVGFKYFCKDWCVRIDNSSILLNPEEDPYSGAEDEEKYHPPFKIEENAFTEEQNIVPVYDEFGADAVRKFFFLPWQTDESIKEEVDEIAGRNKKDSDTEDDFYYSDTSDTNYNYSDTDDDLDPISRGAMYGHFVHGDNVYDLDGNFLYKDPEHTLSEAGHKVDWL